MMQFVSVSLLPVNIRIAPPSEELFLPLVRARSEIETVPRPKLNKKVVAFPLMTKALAPGPLMLMALDSGTLSGPLVRIIVPVTLNSMCRHPAQTRASDVTNLGHCHWYW